MTHASLKLTRALFGQSGDWLAPIYRGAMPGAIVVLATSLVAATFGLVMPYVTKLLIDQGIMAGDMSALVFWAAISFGAGLAAVGLGALNGFLHLRASAGMLAGLRGHVLTAALERSPSADQRPLGELTARVDGDSAEIQRFTFDSVLVAVGAVFRLLGGAALMIALDWRLALIPVLMTPLELWFLSWARPGTTARAAEVRDARGLLSSHLTESIALGPRLRALDGVERRQRDFDGLQVGQIGALVRQRLWTEMIGGVSQAINAVTRSAVLLIGGYLVIAGEWPIGSLVAFLAYTGMMSGPLRNLLGLYHAQARARVSLDRLSALIGETRDPAEGECAREGELVFRGARADGAHHLVVDAVVAPGSMTLLDGPSGIGKSRLAMAILREADLADGEILLGGRPVVHLSPQSLRRRVSYIGQNAGLPRGTLGEVLRLAAPEADDEDLWRVITLCRLDTWALENGGLGAVLWESGQNLSGGFRQRVNLALGLLRPSDIVVCDESISEIDTEEASRILDGLRAAYPNRTFVFVAHSGPAREMAFDQQIVLLAGPPPRRSAIGETPTHRAKARENAD